MERESPACALYVYKTTIHNMVIVRQPLLSMTIYESLWAQTCLIGELNALSWAILDVLLAGVERLNNG